MNDFIRSPSLLFSAAANFPPLSSCVRAALLKERPEFERDQAEGGLQIAVASSPAAYFEGRTSQSERALAQTDALEILRKLGSYPRQNSLALALREMGRIERTLFMLEWLRDPALRRRVTAGLNTGEAHDALARSVCFNETRRNSRPLFRKPAPQSQRFKPDCRCNHRLEYGLSATGDQSFRNVPSVRLVLAPACFSARLGACQPHRRLHLALKQTCGQRWLPTHPNTSKLQKRLRRALAYINFRSVRCPLL